MDKSIIHFLIFVVVVLVVVIFLKITLVTFTRQMKKELQANVEENNLLDFAYDIHFNPPPDQIIIDNPYECTPLDLKPCTLDNGLSCAGCKSLLATCVHFPKDTKFIDYNGVESIIKANATENDGYCLTQVNSNQRCNPYHGDLVLIQTDPDSKESLLYCDCKNPGYIGNTELLGGCDTVFICNGKIDNLQQPLENIKCLCENDMISVTKNDVPTCVAPTVAEFTKYNDPSFFNNVETVPKDRFIDDVKNRFPGQHLRNPCKYCLLTGNYVENGEMVPTDDDGWQCVLRYSTKRGMPIRRHDTRRILRGSRGPDAVIDIKLYKLLIHGYLNETTFEQMTAMIRTSDNSDILKYLNVPIDKTYAFINLQKHELVFPESFGAMRMNRAPGVYCTGPQVPGIIWDDLSFHCYFSNTIPSNRNPGNYDTYIQNYAPGFDFATFPECPPKHHSVITGNSFKWWYHYEAYNSAHSKNVTNGLMKYEISQYFKRSQAVKYIMSIYNFDTSESNHYGTPNEALYDQWFAQTIPTET